MSAGEQFREAGAGRAGRRVAIAGASGLIGTALTRRLEEDGTRVLRLVRREARTENEIAWDPARRQLDARKLSGVDAVVNLAGENLAEGRWTAARREAILRSRIDATHTLVEAMRRATERPRVLVNASAVGIYGDRGDVTVDETSPRGRGFLADVCVEWEATARAAEEFGTRVVCARFGMVLSKDGGALPKMLPVFRAGLGGKLGNGRQWMSWVGIDDVVNAIVWALGEERCAGPINVVAPQPVTNADFTEMLGHVLRRPTVMRVPTLALKTMFGAMADEALLASTRAVPKRLREWGFGFRDQTLEAGLRNLLDENPG